MHGRLRNRKMPTCIQLLPDQDSAARFATLTGVCTYLTFDRLTGTRTQVYNAIHAMSVKTRPTDTCYRTNRFEVSFQLYLQEYE